MDYAWLGRLGRIATRPTTKNAVAWRSDQLAPLELASGVSVAEGTGTAVATVAAAVVPVTLVGSAYFSLSSCPLGEN